MTLFSGQDSRICGEFGVINEFSYLRSLRGTWNTSEPHFYLTVTGDICILMEAVSSVLVLEYETCNYSRNLLTEAALSLRAVDGQLAS